MDIRQDQQRLIEENLFAFSGAYTMTYPVFVAVAFIPIEASDLLEVKRFVCHICIL